MPSWDEIFKEKTFFPTYPQTEVFKFVERLESTFQTKPLNIWDHCCGTGRNSIAIADMGHRIYSSDISPNGINNLEALKGKNEYWCHTALCDMTVNPWQNTEFHGVICWDAIHHNTLTNIQTAVNTIYDSLMDGGLFMASLLSTKSGHHKKGKQIEPNTFVNNEGLESGIPHHYFDEAEIRSLFRQWKFCILSEVVVNYIETEFEFYKNNPFPYTKWNILVMKKS
jgi:2-polyprenyl-3-methyl-5-hydroxy-6-metoxy-1,4-benzoquinol methylase